MAKNLAEVAAQNLRVTHGYRTLPAMKAAADACATVACLAIAGHVALSEGREWPTQREYAKYWKLPQRTAEKQWADWRKAFSFLNEQTPDRMARAVANEYQGQLRKRDATMGLSLGAEFAEVGAAAGL
jgi:hypothetical protein